jgi:hypothetical protein
LWKLVIECNSFDLILNLNVNNLNLSNLLLYL